MKGGRFADVSVWVWVALFVSSVLLLFIACRTINAVVPVHTSDTLTGEIAKSSGGNATEQGDFACVVWGCDGSSELRLMLDNDPKTYCIRGVVSDPVWSEDGSYFEAKCRDGRVIRVRVRGVPYPTARVIGAK